MNLLLLHLMLPGLSKRLVGRTLEQPTWFAPILTIPVRTTRRLGYLVAVLETPGPFCFFASDRPLDRAATPKRLNILQGCTVTGVDLKNDDRILVIDVTRDDETAQAMSLEIHLYGSAGHVALRRDDMVIESLGTALRRAARSRDDGVVPLQKATAADIERAVASESVAQSIVPGLDDRLIEAFTTAGKTDAAAVVSFRDQLLGGKVSFSTAHGRKIGSAVPIPAGKQTPVFTSGEAAGAAVGDAVVEAAQRDTIARLSKPLRRRLSANQKLIANLERDLARADDSPVLRREAETLAAYQSSIKSGAAKVTLADIYDASKTIDIELDPAKPIHQQIEKRFKKASKLEKSRVHSSRRLELVRREILELEAGLKLLEKDSTFGDAILHLEALSSRFDITPSSGGGRKRTQTQGKTWRTFDLTNEWFVLVGRSNHENDELTFKQARPGDLWFHAQGVAGSHVILKSRVSADAPPATVLEQAASVAAHFSKARHSELVPVIYTLRKYVRKFRGAKPGQVTCEREKMVMVPPVLPATPDE